MRVAAPDSLVGIAHTRNARTCAPPDTGDGSIGAAARIVSADTVADTAPAEPDSGVPVADFVAHIAAEAPPAPQSADQAADQAAPPVAPGDLAVHAFFSAGRHRVASPADNATTAQAPSGSATAAALRSTVDGGGHPTLLDAATAAWPDASPVPAQPNTRPGRRRPRSGLAVLGAGLALVGVLFISIAAGVLTPADLGLGSRGGASQGDGVPTGPAVLAPVSPTPNDPSTPSAAMTAMEAEVASALSTGRIDARAARDLSSDIKTIRDRLNRQSDIQRSGAAFQRKVDNQVGDGDMDVSVGAELSRLMDILMRLSSSARGSAG